MVDILNQILETKKQELERLKLIRPQLNEAIKRRQSDSPADSPDQRRLPREFAQALISRMSQKKIAVIAEIKKASPSKGVIRADFDPPQLARDYQSAGATALSVLTDVLYFQGCADYLKQARAACRLPVLRKDFIIDPLQISEAYAMGADAVLLIVSAFVGRVSLMRDLELYALELGLDVLVETHDEFELEQALSLQTPLIGVNNRNLRHFEVDIQRSFALKAELDRQDPKRFLISESGIAQRETVLRLCDAGIYGFLVGESMMREKEIVRAFSDLFA